MRKKLFGAMLLLIPFIFSNQVCAWNCPRDEEVKQFHPRSHFGFLADYEHRDIKVPDKWRHFTGCHLSQKLLASHLNKYLSTYTVISLSISEEYEYVFKKGWNLRDIFTDFLGIFSKIYTTSKYKLSCPYDNKKITLNLLLNIDF